MFNGKRIIITGGTGTLGRAVIKYIFANYSPEKVIVFSRDEFKQFNMRKEFPDPQYDKLRFLLGDVRDYERLKTALHGVDYVVHAAALKQVPMLEYNPEEAVKTNVLGSMNVVRACIENNVKRAVLVSTDKSVNPISLYGATKLTAEKLFIAANAYNKTEFCCVRYGNVIGSRGSVIPYFQELIKNGSDYLPLTNKLMTRFWITTGEAVNLVMRGLSDLPAGKILIPMAKSMTMGELAGAMNPWYSTVESGIRAGEKMHESLSSEDNANVCILDGDEIKDFHKIYTSDKAERMTGGELVEKINGG